VVNTTASGCEAWLAASATSSDLVVMMGSQFDECMASAGSYYSSTWFLNIDSCNRASNVFCASSPQGASRPTLLAYTSGLISHFTRVLPPM